MVGDVRAWLLVGVVGVMGVVWCGGARGEDGPVWRAVEGLPEGVSVVVSVRSPEALRVKAGEAMGAWGVPAGVGWVMDRLGLVERVAGVVGADEGWRRGGMRPMPPRALRDTVAEQDVVVMVDQRGVGAIKRSFLAVAVGVVLRQEMIDRGIDAAVATSAGNAVAGWVRLGLNVAEVVMIGVSRVEGATRVTLAAQASAAKRWVTGAGLSRGREVYDALPERSYLVRGRLGVGLPEAVESVTAAWYVPTLAGMRASGPIEAAAWVEGQRGLRGEVLQRWWLGWLKGLEREALAWPPVSVPGRDGVAWALRNAGTGARVEGVKGAAGWRVEARFSPEAYERYDPMVMLMDGASLSGATGVAGTGMWLTVGREVQFVEEVMRAAEGEGEIVGGGGVGPKRLLDAEVSVAGMIEAVNLYAPLLPGRLRLPEVGLRGRPVSVSVEVMREGWRSGVVVATLELPDDAGRSVVGVIGAVAQRLVHDVVEPARP
ncbi:MAG: hypothetical protein AAF750_05260 [Planctomycetota bacterium]